MAERSPMKQRLLTRWLPLSLLLVGAVAILVACGGGGNDDTSDPVAETERSQALGLFDKLPVSWTPTKLVFNLNPGSRQSIPVTLTTTKALTNARVVFVPDFRNAVTVSPSTIPTLAAGQSATVTLTFAPSATDTRKALAGVVLLYDRNATVSRPLPVKVSLVAQETINGVAVPPEPPSELNNATLAGFDVNANGVRDDVERYVISTFSGSKKRTAVASELSRANQQALLAADTNDRASLIAATRRADAAVACLNYIDPSNAASIENQLAAVELNTRLRWTVAAKLQQLLGGLEMTVPADKKAMCTFDPESMAN
jgi:hypothetical protein